MKKPTTRKPGRLRVLISGGGTGGHIFPALSIANILKERYGAEILFVGADNRMEMERVPAAGYKIIGLPVAGFDRKHLWRNLSVLMKLWRSILRARSIVRDFKPDIAIGVGGYASGPTLKAAQRAGVPTLLQEQNSYPGVTNKLLGKKAEAICMAYEGGERFFPADKIIITGNPVRKDLLKCKTTPSEARLSFGFDPDRPTVLVTGGSLGALTLNETIEKHIGTLTAHGLQVIWQTGKNFGNRGIKAAKGLRGVVVTEFLNDMGTAYAAATLVVSRAGAGAISELELLGKPVVLVPSPNVAEDHQTKNARALSDKGAAILVPDDECRHILPGVLISLARDKQRLQSMSNAISAMARHDSDKLIANEVKRIVTSHNPEIQL